MMRMSALKPGQKAILKTLQQQNPVLEQLLHMGFFDGAHVELTHINFGGTLAAFIIDDSMIALRTADCKQIEVTLQ